MRSRKKDADFTNIRIHIKTHEELDAIGRRGESMDDIVQKCLEAYRKIDRQEKEYDKMLLEDIEHAMQQSKEIITEEENMLKEEHERRRQAEVSTTITKDKKSLEEEYNRRNEFLEKFEQQRLENVKMLEYWSKKAKIFSEVYEVRSHHPSQKAGIKKQEQESQKIITEDT